MYPFVCLIYLNIAQTSLSSSIAGKEGHKHIVQSGKEVETETDTGGDIEEYIGEDTGLDKHLDIGEDIIADIGLNTGDNIDTDNGEDIETDRS